MKIENVICFYMNLNLLFVAYVSFLAGSWLYFLKFFGLAFRKHGVHSKPTLMYTPDIESSQSQAGQPAQESRWQTGKCGMRDAQTLKEAGIPVGLISGPG